MTLFRDTDHRTASVDRAPKELKLNQTNEFIVDISPGSPQASPNDESLSVIAVAAAASSLKRKRNRPTDSNQGKWMVLASLSLTVFLPLADITTDM